YDDRAVRGRHEGPALLAELLADLVRVRDVAVVRERDLSVRGLGDDRLRVVEHARSGRRIADVTDPGIAAEIDEVLLGEDLVHEAHPAFRLQPVLVDRAARGLLPTLLPDAEAILQARGDRLGAL